MYIYLITNLINKKKYVGQAQTLDYVKKRWANHKCGAGNQHVYNSIQKYGVENFKFEIIDEASITQDELDLAEIQYIDYYNSMYPNGYNRTSGGDRNDRLGTTLCEASKNLIRQKQTGKKYSEETNKKKGDHCRGVRQSEDHKRKRKEARLEYYKTEQGLIEKQNLSIRHKNKIVTEESRKKMSESQKELRKEVPIWNKGRKGLQIAWNVGLGRELEQKYKLLTKEQKKYFLSLPINERKLYLNSY